METTPISKTTTNRLFISLLILSGIKISLKKNTKAMKELKDSEVYPIKGTVSFTLVV